MSRKVVFLDRDGTLNVDHGFVHGVEDWEFTDGAPEAVKRLRDAGYAIALVTNQSGIARGYFTLDHVRKLHGWLQERLTAHQAAINAIAICPHGPDDDCPCRKPRTEMAKQIEQVLGEAIDYANSWTIGDKLSDQYFGIALGTHTALIKSDYWKPKDLVATPDVIADTLAQAVEAIVRRET
jgi:D-glycero-D-manno-heptose 1,7-bisphosphate phosphatase